MQLIPKSMRPRVVHKIAADYRYNVPMVIKLMAVVGVILIVIGIGSIVADEFSVLAVLAIISGGVLIVPRMIIASILHSFQDLRYHIRDAIVLGVQWRGDEHVLDVGVGSGLMLFECAKKLRNGKAVGIDLFKGGSGGGDAQTFWRNASHEGVKDQVELEIADASQMPFEDDSFDVIVSTSVFHHMGGAEVREKASREIVRVLKPNGRLLVYDHRVVLKELEGVMQEAGFVNMRADGDESALIRGDKPA